MAPPTPALKLLETNGASSAPLTLFRTLLLLSLAFATGSGVAEEEGSQFQGLAREMTPGEFSGAGLDKLTPEELARLDRWIEALAGRKQQTTAITAEREQALPEPDAMAAGESRAAEPAAGEARRAGRPAEQQALIDAPFQNGRWVGPKPKRIEARIDGDFAGWQGNTVFVLDNGQVWQQRLQGRYYHKAASPEVLITRNIMGYFVLRVVATGQRIGVKRVR